MANQSLQDLVLSAINTGQNPASTLEQRKDAVFFIEQLKRGDAHALCGVSVSLVSQPLAVEAVLAGYSLLSDLVKDRWSELNEAEQAQVFQLACQNLASVCQPGASVAWALKSKVAVLLAAIVRQKGASSYNELLPQLLGTGTGTTTQAEVACMVLQFVSEDLTQFDNTGGDPKRVFLQCLTASAPTVYPFLCQMLQDHFVAAMDSQAAGRTAEIQSHSAVISASLGALSTWVEWMPMSRVTQSNVLEACTYFMTAPDFRLQALDVLKAVASRKRSGDSWVDYSALMEKLITLVLQQCQKQGLLPTDGAALQQGVSKELDWEGSLEEYGKRLCSLLVVFGEQHYRSISAEPQLLFLQQMLAFSRHPYLLLSSLVLPMWAQLLREAAATVAGPNSPGPEGSTAAASGKSGVTPGLPTEIYPAIMSCLAEQLQQVVGPCIDKGSDFPLYFESFHDYKESCSDYRGKVKNTLRYATQIAPEAGLTTVSKYLQGALASIQDAALDSRKKMVRFESAVVTIEAALPPLIELATQIPAAAAGLETLLQSLLQVSFRDQSGLIPLFANGLQAFGRFLAVRPHLVTPIIEKVFSTMLSLPLEAHGHLPPPPRISNAWRTYCAKRIDMATCLVAMAKASPSAFAPHLEPLVVNILQLWDKGLLLEGERVLLWEGLLLASGHAGQTVQAQMVEGIFTPMHSAWTSPSFQQIISSPLSFVRHYLPIDSVVEAGAGGAAASGASTAADSYVGPVVGARSERWTLYHQLTLLERSIRRTATQPPPPQSADPSRKEGAGAVDLQHEQYHPFNAHLHWCLPPVGAMLRCVHGLDAVEAQQALGHLRGITQMDPIEKALRSGEDVDSLKGQTEPRCVAGSTLADARYFIRGVRESCIMILSLAGTHCSALWTSQQLASQLLPAVMADLEGLELGHLRLLLRHTLTPWIIHCPPGSLQQLWSLPICQRLLPHMHQRLSSCWAAMSSPTTILGSTPEEKDKKKAATEEVVIDSLLREVSREHASFLQALIKRAPAPSSAHAGAEVNGSSAQAAAAGADGAAPAEGPALLDLILQMNPATAEAGMRTAVAGICWPDQETAQKSLHVCRYISEMALTAPSLESFVCGEMLRSGIISLVQVYTIIFQADVLALLRAIIVKFMLKGSTVAHNTLQQLLQIPQQKIQEFDAHIRSLNSEKDQRHAIRQLVADSAGEEVRKMLAAVSKINTTPGAASSAAALAVSNESQRKSKDKLSLDVDFDQHLSGAIYGMIFPEST